MLDLTPYAVSVRRLHAVARLGMPDEENAVERITREVPGNESRVTNNYYELQV